MEKNINENEYIENLVSIITPVYNNVQFIHQTIESVQKQTYTNWEMIIVDDASRDDTETVVKRIAEKDRRIKYFKNEINLGVSYTRNKAIGISKGRYIAFLDGDDLWKEDKLRKQITFMEQEDIAFCYSGCDVVDESGKASGKIRRVPQKIDYRQLLKGNEIPCLTVILDRNKFSKIYMPTLEHEDYATWLKLLKECQCAYGVCEELASYRVSMSSLSGNKIYAAKWTWNIYRKYLGLSIFESMYYFFHYLLRAFKKWI